MLANSLLKEVVDGKSTLDAAHAKMLAALHKRPDYSQGTDEFRKELDEGNVKGDKRKMLAALGQVYVFEVVDKHGKKQANFCEVDPDFWFEAFRENIRTIGSTVLILSPWRNPVPCLAHGVCGKYSARDLPKPRSKYVFLPRRLRILHTRL
eukprot:g73319.t1